MSFLHTTTYSIPEAIMEMMFLGGVNTTWKGIMDIDNFDRYEVSLHSSIPVQDDGTIFREVAGGAYDYEPKTVVFLDGDGDGSVKNTLDLTWTNMPAETLTHLLVCIISTTEVRYPLQIVPLTSNVTLRNGDTFRIPATGLHIYLEHAETAG